MTKEEHIKIHKRLHSSLDELVGDFVLHDSTTRYLHETSVMELMKWSATQLVEPTKV